jgi:hypothetical protein
VAMSFLFELIDDFVEVLGAEPKAAPKTCFVDSFKFK